MQHIVVSFGSDTCEMEPNLSRCPTMAYGPFETNEEAKTFARTLPKWTAAHCLLLFDEEAIYL